MRVNSSPYKDRLSSEEYDTLTAIEHKLMRMDEESRATRTTLIQLDKIIREKG